MSVATLPVTPKVTYEENALHLPVGLSFDDFCSVGASIQQMQRSISWWLGDWGLAGERFFSDIYSQAVEDYSVETLQTAMRVCRAFPPQRRQYKLGFSFYQRVYKRTEKEQDELLSLAAESGWTREVFREEVKARDLAALRAEQASQQPPTPLQLAAPDGPRPTVDDDGEATPEDPGSDVTGSRHLVTSGNPEPAPETPTDAAILLKASLNIFPEDIAAAVRLILAQRQRLIDVLDAAEDSIRAGWMLPSLEKTVIAAR